MTSATVRRLIWVFGTTFTVQAVVLSITDKKVRLWREVRHVYIYEGDMVSFTPPKDDPKIQRTTQADWVVCCYWTGLLVWGITMPMASDCPILTL
jgi:hypothetical protein